MATDLQIEKAARAICDAWGYSWEGNPDEDDQVAPENARDCDERPSKELYLMAAANALKAAGV